MGGFRNDNGIQFEDIAEANEFVFICWIFYHILPFVMLFNAMALVYFYYVIVTFHSFKFCKCCLILMMIVEWLAVAGLTALYYLSFDLFWNEYLKENREKSIYHFYFLVIDIMTKSTNMKCFGVMIGESLS